MHFQASGAGEYLTVDGQSLYWNDKDVTAGQLDCVEECIATWLPLEAPPNAEPIPDWSIVKRPGGTSQWVYRDKPLYRYVEDTFPGAQLGDGRGRIWHLLFEPIAIPAAMTMQSTLLGRVLANHRGLTLYTQQAVSGDAMEASPALDLWQVFAAPWLAVEQGDWAIEAHANGTRQWTYKGKRLFTYAKDTDAQDIRGHGIDGAWTAVVLEPAPGLPSWVTAQRIDLGVAYADERGMTLYAPPDMDAIRAAQTCPAECMRELWKPILAKPEESSLGHWVILENDTGQRQWSYDGRLLYTHTRDEKPGDMVGNGYAVGYRIGGGFRVILIDPRDRAR